MKPIHITFIYNRRKTASPIKKASIEMRITHDKKQKYISTGIMVYPHQWKKDRIVNTPDADILNQSLDRMLFEVRSISFEEKENIDIFNIPNLLNKLHAKKQTFIDFCIKRAEVRKYGKSKDSNDRYNRFIKKFIEWGKIKEFKDITEENIIAYDKYLSNMKSNSRWTNYHRFLNSFILDAICEGLLHRNPYKWVNIEKDKEIHSIERHLTYQEFQKLKNTKMPMPHLERVKDLFIFQVYTCLSYTDLKHFNKDNITTVNGMKVYTGERNKTGKTFTIPLLPTTLKILERYKYNLPIISNEKYNEYLKVVVQICGITKPVSSHWARHTGATLLLNEGIDMKIVSKICGHSSTRITEQIYAKLLDETVVNAVSSIKI